MLTYLNYTIDLFFKKRTSQKHKSAQKGGEKKGLNTTQKPFAFDLVQM